MNCEYKYNGKTISKELLLKKLEKAIINSKTKISDVLFSKADKKLNRYQILQELKKESKLENVGKSKLFDESPSYRGSHGELSISSFLDSKLAMINGNPLYEQKDIEDYRREELKKLISKGKSEKEAKDIIENTIASWEVISEDGRLIHQLCIDNTIGFPEEMWKEKSKQFVENAKKLLRKNSPFNDDRILYKLYEEFATWYRNTAGQFVDDLHIRNIGLTSKLKNLDQKIFGHIDYAFIDNQGVLHIYNFKATTQSPREWVQAKEDKYKLEGSFIKQMLIDNGIFVNNIGEIKYHIVPIKVTYSEDFTSVESIVRLPAISEDFKGDDYIARKQDNQARFFIETQFGIENISEDEIRDSDKIFEQAFQFMKVSPERVYKSTYDWIKSAKSAGDPDVESLLIKEVNEPDCRYRVILYGKEYDIKDFTRKEDNKEIFELVRKHLNRLNAELGDYSSKLVNAVQKAFKHNLSFLDESLQNSSFITKVLSKYLPVDHETQTDWELNTELIEYNILLFKHKTTGQLDMVTLSSEDFQQLGNFRKGATNILGTFKLDGNKDASDLKGDMGNIELMRGMIMLNQILPVLGKVKLGEIVALSTAKNGQSRKHYIQDFNNIYFKQFLRILKQETGNELSSIVNNISKNEFCDPIDDIIYQYNLLMEGLSSSQKEIFKELGITDLPSKENKNRTAALLELLEKINDTFFKSRDYLYIYRQAHPEEGYNPSPTERIAAKLYELISNAYHQYSGQQVQYQDNLSKIDIYSFTAPTIPDYNVRIVVNNLQTTLDSIAYEENQEYEKYIQNIVLEYYEDCGYSKTQNLVIGNQLHLFDNLYQVDEKGNRLLIFKNPYDNTNDLKPHERKFLKKALFYLNKVKTAKSPNAKVLFKDENDPEIDKYIRHDSNGEKYLWVPLMRASKASERQQDNGSRWDRMKRAFRIMKNSDKWYTEAVSNMTEQERTWMNEDINTMSLRNPFNIGDFDVNSRQEYINKNGVGFFETNVENIMVEYMAKAIEVNKLNKFLILTKSLLLQLHLMGSDSDQAKAIVDKESQLITDYLKQNVFNTSTMDPTNQKIVGALSGLKSKVTMLNLAGNVISYFRDVINGFMENFLRATTHFQTDIKKKYLTEAYQYVITNGRSNSMNINLLSKLNIRYRLSNTDLARIKERLVTNRNGIYNWDNWAYATLRSPDFLNRMTLFVARCMQDGVWDAYSLDGNELKYDVKKDKRFQHFINDDFQHPDYQKEKALFQLHVRNWNKEHPNSEKPLDWADKILPEPYSDQEILAIKNVANNIYGSYDKSLKAQYEHTALGWAFTMYTTWMNGFWNNWFMKPGKYNVHHMETKIQQDEDGNNIYMQNNGNFVTEVIDSNGNKTYIDQDGKELPPGEEVTPVLEEVPVITQGIIYTVHDIFQEFRFRKNGASSVVEYLKANEVDRRNLEHAAGQILIALLFMILFGAALTPAYKESKKKSNNLSLGERLFASIAYRSLNGARDSFAGPLNISEYFGEQLNPPIYRVPMKLIQDSGKAAFGDKTWMSVASGNIALFRAYKDIVPTKRES